jgi:putative endonuclease
MSRPDAATSPTSAAPRRALGEYGERLAARRLTERGLVVLDSNWRCDLGEIDLVLRDGSVLVICEVKTRTSHACGSPHEAVTPAKLARLRRLAARWVIEHDVHPPDVRIDLVAVTMQRRGMPVVEHIEGLA